LILEVEEQDELVGGRPSLRAAVELRALYIDALSFLQLRFMDDRCATRLVHATIGGAAAGL
jgi:phosphoenolpyruvate carboxylase